MILPENLWKSPVIQKRLAVEAGFECNGAGISEKKHYWCLVPFADSKDGVTVLRNYEKSLQDADPHEMQQEFARQVMTMLQREAGFDGLWLVGWTHPPSSYEVLTDTGNCWARLIMIWHDSHGDPQYTVESDFPFVAMMEAGEAYYVGLAHDAHQQWKEVYGPKVLKADMGLKDHQVKSAALEALKQ